MPNGNITTAANDVYVFRCIGSGSWVLVAASRTPFAYITGRPTTLAGYGITDGQTALGYTPVNKAGDTNVGAMTFSGGLTIQKDNGSLIAMSVASGLKTFAMGNSYLAGGDGIAWLFNLSNDDMVFGTNGTERGRIKNTGELAWGAAGLKLNGGQTLTKITLGTAAPGALAAGELYLQY